MKPWTNITLSSVVALTTCSTTLVGATQKTPFDQARMEVTRPLIAAPVARVTVEKLPALVPLPAPIAQDPEPLLLVDFKNLASPMPLAALSEKALTDLMPVIALSEHTRVDISFNRGFALNNEPFIGAFSPWGQGESTPYNPQNHPNLTTPPFSPATLASLDMRMPFGSSSTYASIGTRFMNPLANHPDGVRYAPANFSASFKLNFAKNDLLMPKDSLLIQAGPRWDALTQSTLTDYRLGYKAAWGKTSLTLSVNDTKNITDHTVSVSSSAQLSQPLNLSVNATGDLHITAGLAKQNGAIQEGISGGIKGKVEIPGTGQPIQYSVDFSEALSGGDRFNNPGRRETAVLFSLKISG